MGSGFFYFSDVHNATDFSDEKQIVNGRGKD